MGFMGRPKGELGKHLLKENICLITLNKSRSNLLWNFIGVSKQMICEPTSITSLDGNYGFPLYLYSDNKVQQTIDQSTERTPNLNLEIVNQISDNLGLTFTNEKETTKDTFAPIDMLDYIYAVLHSPTYREKYKEFLKIDFPRVPYPKDQDSFWKLVKLGGEIRQIHLLESPVVEKFISKYPITGTNIVEKPKYENGKVMINETQYFEDVPEVAWNFYIGGYQPAQKWLKDRKDRELQIEDILHYLKIIVALTETDRLMKELDKIEIE
jgi:predicted helicase